MLKISMERVKVVGIPGGIPKFEEKTWISRGVNENEFQGVMVKSTGNSGGQLQIN